MPQVVSVETGSGALRVVSGFSHDPPDSLFKILSEEMGYNKEFKPFKILILDRVLDLDSAKTRRRPTIIK